MNNKSLQFLVSIGILIFLFTACEKSPIIEEDDDQVVIPADSILLHHQIVKMMAVDYVQMPEKQMAINADSTMYAQYALPTERYKHGALGDFIEAGQLVVFLQNKFYTLTLTENYVFEDVRPRLYDVDNDNIPEIICIRSKAGAGAGIVVYKVLADQIIEFAFIPEIGTASRWLNIVAIYDMDQDGITELIWVETPHIGGILKGADIVAGQMLVADKVSYYSNHQGGSLNLCLSVLVEKEGKTLCYVPSQSRNFISGFSFMNGKFNEEDKISQSVNFSIPLIDQFQGEGIISNEINCIY